MTFSVEEGWTILAALGEWNAKHSDAYHIDIWKAWWQALDEALRYG